MRIRESVIVMNTETWRIFMENAIETASLQEDPIAYISKINSIEVKVDDRLPDNVTEIWYKDVWEFNQKLEQIKKEKGEA